VRKVPLGEFSLYYGVRGDAVVASTSTAAFRGMSGPSLEDDPLYSDAVDAVDLPEELTSLVYVNIRDSIPLLEGVAQQQGEPVPRDLSANLAPLKSLLGYSTSEGGDITKFSTLLDVE
jgi:hypothetical protein